jgi:hypothetical protein
MAEEKPRAPRARKKTTKAETEAAEGKTTAKQPSRAKAAASTPKPAAKKKTVAATSRSKRITTVAAVEPHDVATLAYLLWEQGEPGDAAEHWLRAEQELAAA